MGLKKEQARVLAALRARFVDWRRENPGAALPEELWEAAIALAHSYVGGSFVVACELGLDYAALQARLVRRKNGQRRKAPGVGAFVEIDAGELLRGPVAPAETVIELSGASGAKLVIRLGGRDTIDVVGLATAFLRGAS